MSSGRELETVKRYNEQVLGTLLWAEENVPGTNLQSDIIALRDVCLPRLDTVQKAIDRLRTASGELDKGATRPVSPSEWEDLHEEFMNAVGDLLG